MKEVVAGVDLGGTSTKLGLITRKGQLLCKTSIDTDSTKGYEYFFDRVSSEFSELLSPFNGDVTIKGIGIGAPDANSIDGKIYYASNLAWTGIIPIVDLIESKTNLPVTLMNDANAAAIGEKLFGVATAMNDFIAITLGTGLGSGIVIHGEIVLGHNSHAGELGHTTAFYNGRICGCGKRGCLESYVSATGIVRSLWELLESTNHKSILRELAPSDVSAKMITEAARRGDELALEVFDYTAKILGIKLAEFVAFSNPEAIIFSGGLTNAGDILLKPTKKYMEENLMEVYKDKVKIIKSGLVLEDVGILGAAASIWNKIDSDSSNKDLQKLTPIKNT
ncbi:MAG: ROK family protein [Balneolales bacterium]